MSCQKSIFQKLLSKKDYLIIAEDLKVNACHSFKKEKEIIKEAQYFEQKYKVNYFRDGILQDREHSYKFIDNFKPDSSFICGSDVENASSRIEVTIASSGNPCVLR